MIYGIIDLASYKLCSFLELHPKVLRDFLRKQISKTLVKTENTSRLNRVILSLLLVILLHPTQALACSVLYYKDLATGKIYAVNAEDYYLDVDAYIQIEPKSKRKFARLWYGWDDFAQGGINEHGLFFDAAITPEQQRIKGYRNPRNNLGDKILALASTVEEALEILEKEKIALNKSHMLFGDRTGQAVIVEWVGGERKLRWIDDNKLVMTNFLLSEPEAGNHPDFRYNSIIHRINELESSGQEINLNKIGNTFGLAVQPARADENKRLGGTIYTSFIDITDNKFVLSYRLSNDDLVILDLEDEFAKSKRQTINFEKLFH